MKSFLEKYSVGIIKFFLLGMFLQFILFTFVTRRLGISINIIWLRKEILVLLVIASVYFIGKDKIQKGISNDQVFLVSTFLIGVLLSAFTTLIIHGQTIGEFAGAFKYDFIGYLILIGFFYFSYYLTESKIKTILKYMLSIFKRCLILSFFRYCIIFIKPGILKVFGYSTNTVEGRVGEQPPAVYYTQLNQGFARNQFIFERPIHLGFFLTAFFPLFYLLQLRKKKIDKTRPRWFLITFNIITTFSRAAWGTRLIELIICFVMFSKLELKKYIVKAIIPILIIFGLLAYFGRDEIINREYSNTGHVNEIVKGVRKVGQKPFFGRGAGIAGPLSHQKIINPNVAEYNPENQFLQILIEFGIVGFIPRFAIFLRLMFTGLYKKIINKEHNSGVDILISLGIGMIGLCISGMVLHSFSDRMIVYPLMAIYGICRYAYEKKLFTEKTLKI